MATLFPIYLKYKNKDGSFHGEKDWSCRLFVNPTSIDVRKTPSISVTRTMGGNVFQPWPNQPDQITFNGLLYGTRSYQDFKVLQNVVDQLPELKEVKLLYKHKEYYGFVQSMGVKADAKNPRVFTYEFSFLSKDAISLSRMLLGQITSIQTEVDYLRNIYYGLQNQIFSDPTTFAINAASSLVLGVASIDGGNIANKTDINTPDITDQTKFNGKANGLR